MPLSRDKPGGFEVDFTDQINSGIWPENFATRIPLWSFGRNIIISEIGVRKVKGHDTIITTGVGDPIRGLKQIQEGPDGIAYMGDLTQLYRVNMSESTFTIEGSGYTLDRDGSSSLWDGGTSVWDGGFSLWDFGLIKAGQWSIVDYGTFILATSGTDAPQINRQDLLGFVPMIGLDVTTIEIFVKRGPHVLGFNTSTSSKEFVWSDADNVDDWVATPENLAGSLEIRELDTSIVAAVPLGGRIAVYGEDQMFVVNYLANDLVFGYQPALDGIGAVGKNAVVPVGRMNYGLGLQGFWMADGSQFDYIDDPQVRDWFQNNANGGQLSKVNGYHDESNNCVRWYFPELGSDCSAALSYNYKNKSWSIVDGEVSASEQRTVMSTPITGDEGGALRFQGSGDNADSLPIISYIQTKPLDLGDADITKELDSLRIGFRGTAMRYRVGWSETEDGGINWKDYAVVPVGFDFANLRTSGRWLHIEIGSAFLNASWEMYAMQVIGRAEGTR